MLTAPASFLLRHPTGEIFCNRVKPYFIYELERNVFRVVRHIEVDFRQGRFVYRFSSFDNDLIVGKNIMGGERARWSLCVDVDLHSGKWIADVIGDARDYASRMWQDYFSLNLQDGSIYEVLRADEKIASLKIKPRLFRAAA